ncbi:hypothetical protein NY2A_B645L [Paramecium bursaria Chlorella virus NY2A]|uniref:Uncharacterized protein B645L n=1 Tax=Paramecium bursaria Chlorella virus NY2A TaxID=46021 RepID=A7IXH0_PBCVN|nr:hypothetical protein NY2A_B645L [Paramecium bursaria Chlorella virus NY2A]ABT15044.1 hypothetical protein NY2A_B645L [Paramecium bursaria Chlorella virus NY2A]
MEIVKNNGQLLSALQRIHKHNDAIMFKNHSGEFTMMIRNDPNCIGFFMNIELLIIVEDGDEALTNILKHYPDAIGFDSDGVEFVIETLEIDKRDVNMEDIETLRTMINGVYNYTICNCTKYFIKDDKEMCIFCEMTATSEDLEYVECPICMEKCYNMHGKIMKCCGTKLHIKCDNKWYVTGNKKCVMCRAVLDPRSETRVLNIDELVNNIAQEVERRINNPDHE